MMNKKCNNSIEILIQKTILAITILLLVSVTGLAQSTSRNNPTPVRESDIRGEFNQKDPEYFYSFIAEPGEMTFTLDVKAKNYGGAIYCTLFDVNGRQIDAFEQVVSKGQSEKLIKRVLFVKRKKVVMRIFSGNGEGYYHLFIENNLAQEAEKIESENEVERSTSRNNPAPLLSDKLTDEFHQDDPEYFYTFVAERGTLILNLDLKAKNYGGALYVTLFDTQGRNLADFHKVVSKGQTEKIVKNVFIAKRQKVVMRIFSGNGEGYYNLQINGLVATDDESQTPSTKKSDDDLPPQKKQLPKKGVKP